MSGLFFFDASFWSSLGLQLLNGWAGASSLFLVAAGLSLIFGVTRIVNLAHGSFFMLGIYLAYTLVGRLGESLGFWPAIVLAALVVCALGALIETLLLRRIYKAPELFQLLEDKAAGRLVRVEPAPRPALLAPGKPQPDQEWQP